MTVVTVVAADDADTVVAVDIGEVEAEEVRTFLSPIQVQIPAVVRGHT